MESASFKIAVSYFPQKDKQVVRLKIKVSQGVQHIKISILFERSPNTKYVFSEVLNISDVSQNLVCDLLKAWIQKSMSRGVPKVHSSGLVQNS